MLVVFAVGLPVLFVGVFLRKEGRREQLFVVIAATKVKSEPTTEGGGRGGICTELVLILQLLKRAHMGGASFFEKRLVRS